jgi:hypothetical protein
MRTALNTPSMPTASLPHASSSQHRNGTVFVTNEVLNRLGQSLIERGESSLDTFKFISNVDNRQVLAGRQAIMNSVDSLLMTPDYEERYFSVAQQPKNRQGEFLPLFRKSFSQSVRSLAVNYFPKLEFAKRFPSVSVTHSLTDANNNRRGMVILATHSNPWRVFEMEENVIHKINQDFVGTQNQNADGRLPDVLEPSQSLAHLIEYDPDKRLPLNPFDPDEDMTR